MKASWGNESNSSRRGPLFGPIVLIIKSKSEACTGGKGPKRVFFLHQFEKGAALCFWSLCLCILQHDTVKSDPKMGRKTFAGRAWVRLRAFLCWRALRKTSNFPEARLGPRGPAFAAGVVPGWCRGVGVVPGGGGDSNQKNVVRVFSALIVARKVQSPMAVLVFPKHKQYQKCVVFCVFLHWRAGLG